MGQKIFFDRYALKDTTKKSLKEGDHIIVCADLETGQRELATVLEVNNDQVEVELSDKTHFKCSLEHIDKPLETDPEEMMFRVAQTVAENEVENQRWEDEFHALLNGWKFLPGGRILASAGVDHEQSFYNCFVLPSPKDSRKGIIDTLSQLVEIMSRGGGVGINLSSLRPRHSYIKGVNGRSSGSVSWGALYAFSTGLIEQGGSRRGALMLIVNDWHPDIFEFINIKRDKEQLTNANISVGISDTFMKAVEEDGDWDLLFPDTTVEGFDEDWDGDIDAWRKAGKKVNVYKTVKAREIWDAINKSAWASAEPGLWFKDRSNYMSNSWYFAPLICCNPCGEEPLPGFSVCNLGSLNLPRFLTKSENNNEKMDWGLLKKSIRAAVRFLDNIVDINNYFFDENRDQQLSERRVGLGTMGLGELLVRLKIRYGSDESMVFLDKLYQFIAVEAYLMSSELAEEKGSFPLFDVEKFMQSGFMQGMPEHVKESIRQKGIRNVTLLTQPPTGTTGTMVGTSTGIEPFFYWEYERRSRLGSHTERIEVYDKWLQEHPDQPLPDYFVTAMELSPIEHVRVVATIQKWVDAAISKTCNVPNHYTEEQTSELFEQMHKLGCKGGTIYRDGSRDIQVLNRHSDDKDEKTSEKTEDSENNQVKNNGINRVKNNGFSSDEENNYLFQDSPSGSFLTNSSEYFPSVRPHPVKRYGATVSVKTPIGTAHITMNDDEDGHPLEVFVETGKAGSDIKAMSEAMGRLISLVLRLSSGLSPEEKIDLISHQLKGIGGAHSSGFGKSRILSLPDAVGKTLAEHYLSEKTKKVHRTSANTQNTQNTLMTSAEPQIEEEASSQQDDQVTLDGITDICPDCGYAALVAVSGCSQCLNCGYSRC